MNGKFFNQGNMGNGDNNQFNNMNNYNNQMQQPEMNNFNQGMNNQVNNFSMNNQPINNDYGQNQMNNGMPNMNQGYNNQFGGFNNQQNNMYDQGMNQPMMGNPPMNNQMDNQGMMNNQFGNQMQQPMMNNNQFDNQSMMGNQGMNNQMDNQGMMGNPGMNNQFNQMNNNQFNNTTSGPQIDQPMMGNQQPVKNYKFFGFDQFPDEQPEALDMNTNNPNQQMSNLGAFNQFVSTDSTNQPSMVGGYSNQPDNMYDQGMNQTMMNNNQFDNQSMMGNPGVNNQMDTQPMMNNNQFDTQPMMGNQGMNNQMDTQPMMNNNQFDNQMGMNNNQGMMNSQMSPSNGLYEPPQNPPMNNQMDNPFMQDMGFNSMMNQPVNQPKEKFSIDFKRIFRDPKKIAIIAGVSIVLIVIISIALSIGGTKTLNCTKEEKLGSITSSITHIVKFKKNNIKDYKYTAVTTYESEEDAKKYEKVLEDSIKDMDGIYKSYNIKRTGKKVTLRAAMDLDKLLEDETITYKELKEELEGTEAVCK